MKKLISNNEIYEAENIIKTISSIIGQDLNKNKIFLFKGISDFTEFQLQDENGNNIEFELPVPTEAERITSIEEVMMMLI